MPEVSEISMSCPKCGGIFKFPSEGIGQTAPCPHCSEAVTLSNAPLPDQKPSLPEAPKSSSNRVIVPRVSKVKYRSLSDGIESRLDAVAALCFIAGIIAALICLFEAFGGDEFKPVYLVLAISSAGSGVVSWLLFRALGEIIRLLKKQAGFEFGGEISGGQTKLTETICGGCGKSIGSDSYVKCPYCNAPFEL